MLSKLFAAQIRLSLYIADFWPLLRLPCAITRRRIDLSEGARAGIETQFACECLRTAHTEQKAINPPSLARTTTATIFFSHA